MARIGCRSRNASAVAQGLAVLRRRGLFTACSGLRARGAARAARRANSSSSRSSAHPSRRARAGSGVSRSDRAWAMDQSTASNASSICASAGSSTPPSESNAQRATWAELLKRVFAIDVLESPHCGARRELIALISDSPLVRRILDHLGLPTEPPRLAPARVSEELAFDL